MATCILTICLFLIVEFSTVIGDCRIPGSLYRGTKNYTKSGLPCQQWDQQTPHRHDYDVYSLATDNFCRNFDKEVPWCFTTNPDVRLEDCKVEICDSPCYSAEVILSAMVDSVVECYPGENPDCGDIEKYVQCLLREISTKHSVECTDERATAILIKKHSEALSQMQSVQVDRTRCFPSPCTRKENIIATENEECLEQYSNKLLLAKSAYTFCRYMTKLMRCVISLLAERDNATCTHKDQIKIVNEIENYIAQILPGSLNGYDLSLCVFSEFSSPKDPVATTPSIEVDSTENLTTVYIIGGVVCLVFLVLIILLFICLLRKRKRQHSCDNSSQRGIQLRYVPARLPSIPSTKDRGSGIYDYIKPDDDEHKYETVQSESHINKQETWQSKRGDIQDTSVNLISYTNPQEVPSYIVIIDNDKTHYLNDEKSLLLQQAGNTGDNDIQKATLKINSERIKEENIDDYHKLKSNENLPPCGQLSNKNDEFRDKDNSKRKSSDTNVDCHTVTMSTPPGSEAVLKDTCGNVSSIKNIDTNKNLNVNFFNLRSNANTQNNNRKFKDNAYQHLAQTKQNEFPYESLAPVNEYKNEDLKPNNDEHISKDNLNANDFPNSPKKKNA